MDGPDYPQDERPGTSNGVPALIHDYRAQREAWREQARNLARMREEVLTAADREAKDIVSTARADIRRILLKARRDLLVLAAQVRAAGRLGEPDDTPETIALLPADDLSQAGDALISARHDVRRVLDETRPDLEGLASEGAALRAALRQRPGASRHTDVRRQIPTLVHDAPDAGPGRDVELPSGPSDFEFTTMAADETHDLSLRVRRPLKAMVVAAATLGGLALMGTGLWLYRPSEAPTRPVDGASAAGRTQLPQPTPSSAKTPATGTRPSAAVSPRPGFVSVNVAATRSSWIRVTVDGRVTAERIFTAGETQQISNAREVSLRAGDAGAVTVSVDGRKATVLGREGEVVTRRFAAESPRVRPATATATAPAPSSPAVSTTAAPPRPQPAAPSVPQASTSAASSTTTSTLVAPARAVDTQAAAPQPSATTPAASSTGVLAGRTAAVDRQAAAPAPVAQASLQDSLTNTFARWFDAYYRQDRATMAAIAPQANVSDGRSEKERMPSGLVGVRRSLEDVKLQVEGPAATLTARITERMEASGQMAETVSFISNIWEQRSGSWQLLDVRIVSASSIGRALR